MKVLISIPCLQVGGTEIQTLSLIEALVAAGHKTIVACYFEHNDDMIERYRSVGAEVKLLSQDGCRPNGIISTAHFLWVSLRRLVKEVQPDVVHVQYMSPGTLPILIFRLLGVPQIIVTTHTAADIYNRNGLRVIKLLTKYCIDAFQCITLKAEEGYFGSSSLFDGALKQHFTIYNALPSHISIINKSKVINPHKITLGVVSRLAKIKGMDLVIPAFNKAREQDSRLKLLIVGDGELRKQMEHQAKNSMFTSDIEFIGMKPQTELVNWYDKIDILLMPSRSEGFGLTAIEGMARGCVPVVANVGGLPEVVTDHISGLIHIPDNISDIVAKICDAIDNLDKLSKGALIRAGIYNKDSFRLKIKELYAAIETNINHLQCHT